MYKEEEKPYKHLGQRSKVTAVEIILKIYKYMPNWLFLRYHYLMFTCWI